MAIDTISCAFSCKQRASLRLSVHCHLVRDISAPVFCDLLQKWYVINPENPQKRGSLKASEEESQKKSKRSLTYHSLGKQFAIDLSPTCIWAPVDPVAKTDL